MSRFRKKPVVIDAWQNVAGPIRMPVWVSDAIYDMTDNGVIHIQTLEGIMTADPGDWIIKGVKKEVYPCKPDIFAATYEPVDQ